MGGLGSACGLGIGLSELLAGRSAASETAEATPSAVPGFGRAKHCIVLFMFGAPAHQDTWDMKPDAPSDVRGEFQPIASRVPGIQVSEHLPRLARLTDRFTQIRSVTHPDNTHTVAMHYMLTGVRHKRPTTNPQNAHDDFPCFGAVTNYHARQDRSAARVSALPPSISLNSPANQVSANNHIFPGFFAGFLGGSWNPMFVPQNPSQPDFQPLPERLGAETVLARHSLLSQLQRDRVDTRVARDLASYQEQAFRMLTSVSARRALAIGEEKPHVRERFGMTPFGQGCLLARRLIEAGVSLVTVNWERDDAYWDTHTDNFNRHKKLLLPNLDQGFSALIEDLTERGLWEETLIVWLAEFGRTPKINAAAGRDHWAACNTVLLAGAGIPGGHVHGASDRFAAYPSRDPVGPEDLAATIYHALGVPRDTLLHTLEGQPQRLVHGEPLRFA